MLRTISIDAKDWQLDRQSCAGCKRERIGVLRGVRAMHSVARQQRQLCRFKAATNRGKVRGAAARNGSFHCRVKAVAALQLVTAASLGTHAPSDKQDAAIIRHGQGTRRRNLISGLDLAVALLCILRLQRLS